MRLASICDMQMGYTPRARIDASDSGQLIIQLRDISPSGELQASTLLRADLADVSGRYLAHPGDVIFRSRGERTTASLVGEDFSEPAIVVLPLMILRPRQNLVLPAYLTWILNQSPAQRHFDEHARGTSIRMVPKSCLDSLVIDIPDLATQRKIVETDALAERERQLAARLVEQKRRLVTASLLRMFHTVDGAAPEGKTP